jgi:hypothetical protein
MASSCISKGYLVLHWVHQLLPEFHPVFLKDSKTSDNPYLGSRGIIQEEIPKPTGKRAIIGIVLRREEELQRLEGGLLQRTTTATF